jgi:hypothetical protein
MSNLLTNGNFSQPTLTTNTFKYYSSNMTEEEKNTVSAYFDGVAWVLIQRK